MKITYLTNGERGALYDAWREVAGAQGIDAAFADYAACGYGMEMVARAFPPLFAGDADVLVYLDTDCFPLDGEGIKALAAELAAGPYAYAGVPDGGQVCHRGSDPYKPNLFFTLYDLRKIRAVWKEGDGITSEAEPEIPVADVERRQRMASGYAGGTYRRLEIARADGLEPFTFTNAGFQEPYYAFFRWLGGKGLRPLWFYGRDAPEVDGDGAATLVLHGGTPLALHSWFAREYGRDRYHTARIDKCIEYARNYGKEKGN